MKFSVIIACYKSDVEDILFTIRTIEYQKMKDFEIVVTDDGSENNHFKEIKEFCIRNGYTNIKFLSHETNKGTVRNFLSALSECSGEYVKPISPGDGLFDEHTLNDIYLFMKTRNIDACFGLLNSYTKTATGINFQEYPHPYDLEAYRTGNKNRILRNIVLYSDHVCGAAMFFKTERFKELLNQIQDNVVLVEDLVQAICAAEGKPLVIFDEYAVWYQLGSGVSTQFHSPVRKRMKLDSTLFYEYVMEQFSANKYVASRRKHAKVYSEENYYLQIMKIIVANPTILGFLFTSAIQKRSRKEKLKNCNKGFLNDTEFLNSYKIWRSHASN